jgi:hypothetical protein
MTLQKDLKRLIRARMQKTGESYTAARAQILAKKPLSRTRTDSPAKVAPPAPPAATFAALAGMTDAAIRAKTGCDWKAWVEALDYAGVADWSHRAIAEHVRTKFGIGPWWSQAVTVGYERIKGLREIGQRRGESDRTFEANKSRTYAVPVARLYRAWADARLRKRWLAETGLTVRQSTPERSLRITWNDGSSVELWFLSKGAGKSTVQVQHRKLASKAAADERKAYWSERLEALSEEMS